MAPKQTLVWSAAAALIGLGGTAQAQALNNDLVVDMTGIPQGPGINSLSENVDFADIDLDGDWDVAIADGGDTTQDQNRLWLNLGGDQAGTLGHFNDVTNARAPQINDDSRDIEFADIDDDGDPDIYISNTAQLQNQGNRWWINEGGEQGGSLGFYTDDTANRWVGLGGPGSSIPPGLLIGGTFVDWTCDCDFGDLDNDGDLDLVHSSYGGAFGGNVPTRIFLNDGDGFFSEFNPSGFQLTGNNIPNGAPALWAQGTQQANTTNTNGTFADIASSALDIDIGDYDGDFDLDILHGARIEAPRFFVNLLSETGSLAFRDVTAAVYPSFYWSGGNNYEQEFGDVNNDGLLDVYGLNWIGFNDQIFVNDGNGRFTLHQDLPGSGADDNEGDFGDFDNDGDLDLFVANFSGSNKLYENQFAQTGSPDFVLADNGPLGGGTTLDADIADLDGDGDLDVLLAQDNGAPNERLRNTNNIQDTHAPYYGNVESVQNGPATASTDVVRALVFDNVPYYTTWYYPTEIELEVNGFELPDVAMKTSQGNIFRGEIPGNLLGSVAWNVSSTDRNGNTGVSSTQNYTNTTGLAVGGLYNTAKPGSLGDPTIELLSVPFPDTTLHLGSDNMPAGIPYAIAIGGTAQPFLIGEFNIGPPVIKVKVGVTNGQGEGILSVPVQSGFTGVSIYAQSFGVGDGMPAGSLSSSRGLEIILQ